MTKFKKIPFAPNTPSEERFIKQANQPHDSGKLEISTFLLRLPYATKRKLKHLSYVTERNMNQICLEAIDKYLEKHLSKTDW